MPRYSLIAFAAAMAQIVIGFIMAAAFLPSGFIIMSYPPLCLVGGFLVMSGFMTLLAGLTLGILAYRRDKTQDKSVLSLALNGSFALGITALILTGFFVKNAQAERLRLSMEKYKVERNDSRAVAASKIKAPYLLGLYDNKVVLVMTTKMENNLSTVKIGDYTVIALPAAVGDGIDLAAGGILDFARQVNLKLFLKLIEQDDKDGLKKLIGFYDLNGVHLFLKIAGDYTTIKDPASDVWPKKAAVIKALKEELESHDIGGGDK